MTTPDDPDGSTRTRDAAGATAAPRGPGASRPGSRWWRVGGASLVLAGLVWGASAVGGGPVGGPDPRGTEDGAGATASPSGTALVGASALACPGAAGAWDSPVAVVAALAPRSVLVGGARPGADRGSGSGDDVSSTSSPEGRADDAVATTAPAQADGAVSTASPDQGEGDDAAVTTGPARADDTAVTTDPAPGTAGLSADDEEDDDQDEDGSAQLVLSGDDGERWAVRPAAPRSVEVDGTSAAFVLGQGDAAPGLAGAQLTVGTDRGTRGAALAPCVQPAGEQWLVGGDGRAGGTEQLVLGNPGPDPVTVTVRVWGAEGEAATTGASGLVVPAGGRAEHLLDALAPGVEAPVVSVTATGGPVAAHLNLLVRDGTTDLGAGTVSPAGAAVPATDLVVPALPTAPEGAEHRVTLRLLAPGEDEAVVDLTALTEDGAVRLPGLVTRVGAGRTVDVDLEDLPARTTGLRLRSDAPVVAAARLEVAPAEGDPEETTGDDDAAATDAPPDDDAVTTAPGEDGAGSTADPRERVRDEPLVRPAGELAWVSASVPSAVPVGTALPDPATVPAGAARLVVSAVDAATATVHWMAEDGVTSTDVLDLANDTGRVLDVPTGARAVWVTTTDRQGEAPGAGVTAAVHVVGADGRGPFVAAATLPDVPWTRTVTTVRPAVP